MKKLILIFNAVLAVGINRGMEHDYQRLQQRTRTASTTSFPEKSSEAKVIARIHQEVFDQYDPKKFSTSCVALKSLAEEQGGFQELVNLYRTNRRGAFPLFTECARQNCVQIVLLLLKNKVKPEKDENPFTWVNTKEMASLFKEGGLEDKPDKDGNWLVHRAVSHDNTQLLKWIEAADISKKNKSGEVAIFTLIENLKRLKDPCALAEILMGKDSTLANAPRNDGVTVLSYLQKKLKCFQARPCMSDIAEEQRLVDLEKLLKGYS